jgi:DNA-binding CsgD family transcriptional regulator
MCDTLDGMASQRPATGVALRHLDLTEVERMILRLYSHGLTSRMVADERGTSPETVRTQTKLLRLKLAAKTTTHAVAIAMRAGLIP